MRSVFRIVLVVSLVLLLTGCVLFTIAAPEAGPPAPNCSELIPGTSLPFNNDAAGLPIDVEDWGDTIAIEIIGHSENRGYDTYLQQMLDDSPIAGKRYIVTNRWIGSHETWRWVTPGERGYQAIEDMLDGIQYPTIALVLTSNNMTYPILQADASDVNFVRFVTETEQLADHLYHDGNGARMIFFSSHRYKPANAWAAYNEMFGIGAMLESAEAQGKSYIQAGPEQHDLHRCCYPDCYAPDRSYTNAAGDQLMALPWYNFLFTALTGEEIPAVPGTPVSSTTQDPIAHWAFDDASGEIVSDTSGRSLHGTVYGGAQWTTAPNSGGLRFDGRDDSVAVPNSTTPAPTQLAELEYGTIVVSFKYEGITNADGIAESLPIFYFGESSEQTTLANGNNSVSIYIGHGGLANPNKRQIYFTVHEDDRVTLCFDSSTASLEQGLWYQCAVVIGPTEHSAYLNGEPLDLHYNAGTGPSSYGYFSTVSTPETLLFGYGSFGVSGTWWHFNGVIDDIAVYDRPLTEQEIRALADAP